MKNLNSLKFLLLSHKYVLVIFSFIQIVLFALAQLSAANNQDFTTAFSIWMTLSTSALVLYMGYYFNTAAATNWILQLPISQPMIKLLPILILILWGIAMNVFYPWGQFIKNQYVFNIGIPVISYILISNSRSYLKGVLIAAISSTLIVVIWGSLFFNWSVTQNSLYVELTYLALFSVGVIALIKKSYVLIPSAALALLIALKTIFVLNQSPKTFNDVVLKLDTFPTQNAINEFKSFTQNKSLWLEKEQYDLERYINIRSQVFVELYLNDQEKIQFIDNYQANIEKWKLELRKKRNLIFSLPIFSQSAHPINEFSVTPEVEKYIYTKNPITVFQAVVLPMKATNEFINLIGPMPWLGKIVIDKDLIQKYIPQRKSDFDLNVEKVIKGNKHFLKEFMFTASLFQVNLRDPAINKWSEEGNFDQIKLQIHSKAIAFMKSHKLDSYDELKTHTAKLDESERYYLYTFICNNIYDNCQAMHEKERASIKGFFELLKFNKFKLNTKAAYLSWTEDLLQKDENWKLVADFIAQIKTYN